MIWAKNVDEAKELIYKTENTREGVEGIWCENPSEESHEIYSWIKETGRKYKVFRQPNYSNESINYRGCYTVNDITYCDR
jgi:hypothetical protein